MSVNDEVADEGVVHRRLRARPSMPRAPLRSCHRRRPGRASPGRGIRAAPTSVSSPPITMCRSCGAGHRRLCGAVQDPAMATPSIRIEGALVGAADLQIRARNQAGIEVDQVAGDGDLVDRIGDLAVLEPVARTAHRPVAGVGVERGAEHRGHQHPGAGVAASGRRGRASPGCRVRLVGETPGGPARPREAWPVVSRPSCRAELAFSSQVVSTPRR